MATARRAPTDPQDFKCPGCGAWASEGGCRDPKKCVRTIVAMERECTREFVHAWDSRSARSSRGLWLLGLEALDVLSIGLVVCAGSGQLLLANRTAEGILKTRDGLALDSDGALCAPRGCSRPLAEVLRQAARTALPGEPTTSATALAARRGAGRRALTVWVESFRGWADGSGQSAALLLIMDSALPAHATEAELHQLYGLTSTEARLANLLMDGMALDDCCHELDICRSTACTHLKRIFKKTRVRRQSELVSLLLKSIGWARVGNPSRQSSSMPESRRLERQLPKHVLPDAVRAARTL
jgi:DNA-binding CsgD family transcriptional regulator